MKTIYQNKLLHTSENKIAITIIDEEELTKCDPKVQKYDLTGNWTNERKANKRIDAIIAGGL